MTLNLTSRRHVAGRFRLLAVAALCLGLIVIVEPAAAQHGGGQGSRGMAASSGDMMGGRGGDRFDHSMSESRPQPHMGLQLGLSGRWWDDHKTIRKLGLSPDQQHRMDTIFEANKPALISLYTNLQREEMNLASLSPVDLQDESKVFAAIDRVSHASNDLEKEKAHYLLQIRQQLDPQQLQTLDREIASTH